MRILVWVKTSFVGFHHWPEAPEESSFLKYKHRHVFHVRLWLKVNHDNRDIEFISLKSRVDDFLARTYKDQLFTDSCEQIATKLVQEFGAYIVEVSEDGENGASVIAD